MSSAVPEPGSGTSLSRPQLNRSSLSLQQWLLAGGREVRRGTGQGCVAHQRGRGKLQSQGGVGEVGSGARVEGGEAVQLVDGLVAGVVPGPRILHEALADVRQRGARARAGQDCEADEAGLTVGRLQLLQVHEHFEINTSFSDNFINY